MNPFVRLSALLLLAGACQPIGAAPLPWPSQRNGGAVTPVAAVDLERYTGFWFEIARVPNRFQRQCVRDTLARYRWRPDGRLEVLNQCFKSNGHADQVAGVARVVDPGSNSRLQVSFFSVLGWRPFWGDYWVIGLDDHYQWAVVGTPDRRYGWVLARTRRLDPATLERIGAVLERQGYRRSAFVNSPQSP